MASKARTEALEPGRVVLTIDGAEVPLTMTPKEFASGSYGYFAQGKVDGQDGRRFQVGINATVIGSKPQA